MIGIATNWYLYVGHWQHTEQRLCFMEVTIWVQETEYWAIGDGERDGKSCWSFSGGIEAWIEMNTF